LDNTIQAGSFKIISESGVAAGIRRIEAVTGREALKQTRQTEDRLREAAEILKSSPDAIASRARNLIGESRTLRKEIEKLNAKLANNEINDFLASKEIINGVSFIVGKTNLLPNDMRGLSDKLKDRVGECVIVLSSVVGDKVNFLISASEKAQKLGAHSGNLVKIAAQICAGGGGGKPGMAQAGGKDPSRLDEALEAVREKLKERLG
jgi:alanyl-tRNA synthetase